MDMSVDTNGAVCITYRISTSLGSGLMDNQWSMRIQHTALKVTTHITTDSLFSVTAVVGDGMMGFV